MSINWIKLSERAREGIKIINALPQETFMTVLHYVHRQMDATAAASSSIATPATAAPRQNGGVGSAATSAPYSMAATECDDNMTLEELEKLVAVPRADFLLLIKTVSYILRRTTTFVLRPTRLQAELREKLQLQDDAKIDAIVRLWVRQTTPILNNLASERYESNEVADVAWKLNVEISSHCQQREKTALAVLQLKTAAGEDINLEMNHEELLQLYQQFECIQGELDSMQTMKQQQQQQVAVTPNTAAAMLTPTPTSTYTSTQAN